MDRSRRAQPATAPTAAAAASAPPATSRLTLRGRKNRRRRGSLWARLPPPRAIADACGRALRRSVPAAAALGVVLAAGTALWLGHRFVTTSDRYAITAIEIRGAERVAAAELRAALPVAVGDNVFTASPTAVAEAARAHPWIAAAEAHRELPDTMVVEVREHRAAALAHLGDLYVIGSDGHPFKRARIEDGDGEGVPVITGLERAAYQRDPAAAARTLTAALAVLARWRAAPTRPAIGELHVGTQGTIALRTHDHGAAIELGPLGAPDAELAARLHTFDAAWAELTAEERARARVLHLDARLDQVTIAFAKD